MTVRCAIYTRKSTDEGLDQEFNSLDAQRESAEAYIESQRHEGWTCLAERYDDGGFSGGTMERPALKRLLADVEAGKIDCIVVYKVDRLSRSLLDFARIIGALDEHSISFVSVTQQFNTATPMGRLMLNVLLSFAQFERETIAERTRDKMSAARKKGKWTGGQPMLGYCPAGGRLEVVDAEAARVRAIYELYLQCGSLIPTVEEINRRVWTTKRWVTKKGVERGGRPFDKNTLFRLLKNVIYLGKVCYQDTIYEGEHDAIVEEDLWNQVQRMLRKNGNGGHSAKRNKYGALLKGLIYCRVCGVPMLHTYTTRNNRRYRYYVCGRAQKQGWHVCPQPSVPAAEIERFVIDQVRCIGADADLVALTLERTTVQSRERTEVLDRQRRALEREMRRDDAELRRLIGNHDAASTARLADLQERIQTAEQRMTAIREEIIALARETVGEDELLGVLAEFEPLWDTLSPREQARFISLLVERIGFDGKEETVAITFRPGGITSVAREIAS